MSLNLTSDEQILLDFLMEIPPNYEAAKRHIHTTGLDGTSISKIGLCYTEECCHDVGEHCFAHMGDGVILSKVTLPEGIFSGLHSTYLYDVVKFLLEYGLAPNAIHEVENGWRENMMWELKYIDNEYIGADTLALLLEHGGDPNLVLSDEALFDDVDFSVWFDAREQLIRWRYAATVHIWMVLVGYGAAADDIAEHLKVFPDWNNTKEPFDPLQLRNHREFIFGLSSEDGNVTLSIFHKRTFWKVAEW